MVHEPVILQKRPREKVIPDRIDLMKDTGVLMLTDVYFGRNMKGVKRGEIKQLLVMEDLFVCWEPLMTSLNQGLRTRNCRTRNSRFVRW